jgi:hypothetical protein
MGYGHQSGQKAPSEPADRAMTQMNQISSDLILLNLRHRRHLLLYLVE